MMADTAKLFEVFADHTRQMYQPRPTVSVTDLPSAREAFDAFVVDCREMDLLSDLHCSFCEGERNVYSGQVEHAINCTLESLERAIARESRR